MQIDIAQVLIVHGQSQFLLRKVADLQDEIELRLQLRRGSGVCEQFLNLLPAGQDLAFALDGLLVISDALATAKAQGQANKSQNPPASDAHDSFLSISHPFQYGCMGSLATPRRPKRAIK